LFSLNSFTSFAGLMSAFLLRTASEKADFNPSSPEKNYFEQD
jgi:hypothetical protein